MYTQKTTRHKSQLKTAKKPIEDKMLEYKIESMIKNEEPITGTAELIYTKKRDGVLPAYNPRTDKFDNTIEAINNITLSAISKRKELSKMKEEGGITVTKNQTSGPESIQSE